MIFAYLDESVIITLFRIYVTVTLFFVGYYLFKKYGFPAALQSVCKKEQEQQELISRIAVLTAHVAEKERIVEKEKLETSVLKKRVDTWNLQCKEYALKKEKEQQQYFFEIKERLEKQKNYYLETQQRAILVPLLFSQVKKDLFVAMQKEEGRAWMQNV